RQAALEPVTSALHLEAQQLAECRCIALQSDVLLIDTKLLQILDRKIQAPLGIVSRNVLPEVCQLQRRAREIREPLTLGIAIAAYIEHQMTHGIGRVAAIAQQVVKARITGNRLVLPERSQ